ncbi:hypothetical protein BZG02_13820 [Labilibaculum filiforme]|uniref:Lipocalin-like domain-containing protein n=1 Tax=Labilibaculum filiforme TaxID=1940526 RepID=A0A2N3HVF0_9BACT|nr:hypothetical protein [Labilibaculum filiforme]PKQ62013.1 hypothetical protein BZG02_13820 [Labilibaculum filiforme]
MSWLISKSRVLVLSLFAFSLLMVGCDDEDSDSADQEVVDTIAETKANLVGEWVLISSTIDNENVASSEFEIVKQSKADFYEDNTYKLVYKTGISNDSGSNVSTSTETGTYVVNGINQVSFFNSSSDIQLKESRLQITSVARVSGKEQTQVDVFIRSDSEELQEQNNIGSDVIEEENDDSDVVNTYDGTAVISKLLGKWKISGQTDKCLKMNTIEFKSDTIFEFIQHKATFNRSDLLNYNISVSYPMPAVFSASVTKGDDTVVFDTEANCQFVKTSQVKYFVKDENTILLKNSTKVKILLEDDSAFKLVFTYSDENGDEKIIEFTYVKM